MPIPGTILAAYGLAPDGTWKPLLVDAQGNLLTSGGSSVQFADAITPTDTGDHQHFTLPNAPNPAASLQLILKGTDYFNQPLSPGGVDYTLSGSSIILNNVLTGSFNLLAWYRH